MSKLIYLWKIIKDRWLRPYDDIELRFNTKAEPGDPLVWRVFINNKAHLASGFEIQGYVYDVLSDDNGVTKYNVGCKGRVRWEGNKAIVFAAKKQTEELI